MKKEEEKIIDWDKKGNVVRFYLGKESLKKWWGDDWNDAPYEHNAGGVYKEFISGHEDQWFDFSYQVVEPSDLTNNSGFCKDDFRDRKIPFLVVLPGDVDVRDWLDAMTHPKVIEKFYLGDVLKAEQHITK